MTNEEKLRSNITRKESVMAEDVIKLFALSLEAINDVKESLEDKIVTNHTTITKDAQGALDQLESIRSEMDSLEEKISDVESNATEGINKAVQSIQAGITRLQKLVEAIPNAPDLKPLEDKISTLERKLTEIKLPEVDLTGLEARINEVELMIPVMPDAHEVTAEEIRDKVESLEGEQRINVSAIEGTHRITVSPTAPEDPEKFDLWVKI